VSDADGSIGHPALVVYALPLQRQSHGQTALRVIKPRELRLRF
jgi:hypothetical protein